jgi:hypothetical protein
MIVCPFVPFPLDIGLSVLLYTREETVQLIVSARDDLRRV